MNITFCVSRLANKFNFFSIQTGWHFSVEHRKRNLEDLLVEHGKLSPDEGRALQKLAHLLQRHSFGKGFIGTPFFNVEDDYSYSDFEDILSEKEFRDLEDSFETLDARWQKIWKEERPRLLGWKDVLTEEAEEKITLESLFETLGKLYQVRPRKQYDVYLLVSAPDSGGGGVWSGVSGVITLECSGLEVNEKNKKNLLGTLFHEISHMLSQKFESGVLVPYLRSHNFFEFGNRIENIPTVTFFSEAIVHAFLPRGTLGQKHLGTGSHGLYKAIFDEGKDYPFLAKWGVYVAERLSELGREYVEQEKSLDKGFLDKVKRALEQFLEE